MVKYVFHRYHYKGSLDRLTKYDSLSAVRAACIKKMKEDMRGPSTVSGIYVIRKEYSTDAFPSRLGVCGWMDGERTRDRKRQAFYYYTGKGGYMGEAGKIRISESGYPYQSVANPNIVSVYNRTKAKKKNEEYGIKGKLRPFGL